MTKRAGRSRSGVGPAVAGSFNPLSLGPTVWLKADLGTGQTVDGASVTTWSDQSGNSNNATGSGTPPVYKTNVQNGLPVVRGSGLGPFFTLPSLASLTVATVVIVVRSIDNGVSTNKDGLWAIGTSANETLFPYVTNTIYDDFGTNSRKTTVSPPTSLGVFNVYEVQTAAGAWTSWLNGTQLYTTASNTVAFSATPLLFKANSTGNTFDGDLGELLLYPTALSTANRQAVEAYLKAKWATP